jgi:hypothetical protein
VRALIRRGDVRDLWRRHKHDYARDAPTIDWTDRRFGQSVVLFMLYGLTESWSIFWLFIPPHLIELQTGLFAASNFTYIFWLIPSLASDLDSVTLYSGLFTSIGGVGSTLGFAVAVQGGLNFTGQAWCVIIILSWKIGRFSPKSDLATTVAA